MNARLPPEIAGIGLEQMFRHAPVAVFVVDAAGSVIHTNDRARELSDRHLGVAMPAHLEDAFRVDIHHLDGRRYEPGEWPAVRSLARGEYVLDERFYVVVPGEERVYIRCSSAPLRDADGTIAAAVVALVDITADIGVAERLRFHASLLANLDDAVIATDADFRVTAWNAGAERLYGVAAGDALGRPARTIATCVGDEARLQLEDELATTGRSHVEVSARHADGTHIDVELIAVAVRGDDGAISGYLGIHRDVTASKQAARELARLEQERARQTQQHRLVADLGLRALASDDLQALMDDAVGVVARALDVDLVGVAQLMADGRPLLRAGVGWQAGRIGTMTGQAGRGSLVGYTLERGEPVVSEDIAADDRFTPSNALQAHDVVSAAAVVIAGRDEPFGVLGAFCRSRHAFSPDDVQFLQTVANVLSAAVERAAGAHRLEDVRERERSRIARDLHDDVLQGLTEALVIGQSRADGPDDELVGVLHRTARQVRGAVYHLGLDHDRDRPFAEALDQLVAVHRVLTPAECEVTIEIDDLPAGSFGRRGSETLRIVGEALTNARRHAGASLIAVHVTSCETRICVDVRDNGRGFDQGEAPAVPFGQGLRGMRERAGHLGAHLDLLSDETGTTVRLYADLVARPATRLTRVLLVEDHTAVREAWAATLARHADIEVVGQAASLAQAREQIDGVDVAVIDLGLPDGYGADLIDDLRKANAQVQILILSATLERHEIARAVALGAGAVLHKSTILDDVVGAIRQLRDGKTLLPLQEVAELVRLADGQRQVERDDRAAIAELTPREEEILQVLADGLTSQQIADRLHISIRTARNHIARILGKLGVHSQIQAVLLGLRYGAVKVSRQRIGPRPE